MLAWSYLKQNPRERGTQVQTNWSELFEDAPLSVKKQLTEMAAKDIPINDVSLFFYEHHMLDMLLYGKKANYRDFVYLPTWMHHLYTYYMQQSTPEIDDIQGRIITIAIALGKWLTKEPEMIIPELTYAQFRTCMDAGITTYDVWWGTQSAFYAHIFKYTNKHFKNGCGFYGFQRAIEEGYRNMTLRFMVECTSEQLKNANDFFRDVPHDKLYDSLNELERAHDERTEKIVNERITHAKGRHYEYVPRFIEICKEYGFILPESEADLIKRGARHNNCVGTYGMSHKDNNMLMQDNVDQDRQVTRLLFTKDATIEVHFKVQKQLIAAVLIAQCKGRYNRDMPEPPELLEFRIHMTGLPQNILIVKEVDDGNSAG